MAHFRAFFELYGEYVERTEKATLEWLGRQDSNLGSRDQNPLPYRLATPHRALEETALRPGEPHDSTDGLALRERAAVLPISGRFGNGWAGMSPKNFPPNAPYSLLRARRAPSIYGPSSSQGGV